MSRPRTRLTTMFACRMELRGLVRDGVVFVRSGGKIKGANTAAGDGAARDAHGRRDDRRNESSSSSSSPTAAAAGVDSAGSVDKSAKKKGKKMAGAPSKSKKSKRSKGEEVAGGGHAGQEAPLLAPAQKEWAPTRTGNLSIGARETGVKVSS